MADGILDVRIESNIRTVLADLKEFDPKLATMIRRKLRQSGDEAIAEMRQVLAQPSPGIVTGTTRAITSRRMDGTYGARRVRLTGIQTEEVNGRSRGARQATAAGLKTQVRTGATRQSIRLTGAGGPFPKSYNKPMWRHPIRFDPATTSKDEVPWVSQGGRPYFGTVVLRQADQMRKRVYEALDEALAELARERGVPSPID